MRWLPTITPPTISIAQPHSGYGSITLWDPTTRATAIAKEPRDHQLPTGSRPGLAVTTRPAGR